MPVVFCFLRGSCEIGGLGVIVLLSSEEPVINEIGRLVGDFGDDPICFLVIVCLSPKRSSSSDSVPVIDIAEGEEAAPDKPLDELGLVFGPFLVSMVESTGALDVTNLVREGAFCRLDGHEKRLLVAFFMGCGAVFGAEAGFGRDEEPPADASFWELSTA